MALLSSLLLSSFLSLLPACFTLSPQTLLGSLSPFAVPSPRFPLRCWPPPSAAAVGAALTRAEAALDTRVRAAYVGTGRHKPSDARTRINDGRP